MKQRIVVFCSCPLQADSRTDTKAQSITQSNEGAHGVKRAVHFDIFTDPDKQSRSPENLTPARPEREEDPSIKAQTALRAIGGLCNPLFKEYADVNGFNLATVFQLPEPNSKIVAVSLT